MKYRLNGVKIMNFLMRATSILVLSSSLLSMEIAPIKEYKKAPFATLKNVANYTLLAQLQNAQSPAGMVQVCVITNARNVLLEYFNNCINQASTMCENSMLHSLHGDTLPLDYHTMPGSWCSNDHATTLHSLMFLSAKMHTAAECLDRAFDKKIVPIS